MNLTQRLAERAAKHPQREAIVEGSGRRRRSVSFAELYGRVASVASALRRGPAALGPGDPALVLAPMSIDLYVAVLGVMHAGAVAVFVDPALGRARADALIERIDPRLFVGSPKAQLLRLALPSLRRVRQSICTGSIAAPGSDSLRSLQARGASHPADPVEVDSEDAALITFTSGTTQRPRGMARSHRFLLAQHQALSAHLSVREGDVDLPTLPVFVLHALACGATAVIADGDLTRPGHMDPARVLRQMAAEGVNTSSGSPAFFGTLSRYLDEAPELAQSLSALRDVYAGGALVSPTLAERMVAQVPHLRFHAVYGSTEAEPIAAIDHEEMRETVAATSRGEGVCAGRPVDEVRCNLGPLRSGAWEGPPPPAQSPAIGEVGEVLVTGAHVGRGYIDDPDAEALAKIRVETPAGDEVWHRTGDAARLDDQGRLWLLGRTTERLPTELWPAAIEGAASLIPGVRRAAFLPVRGRHLLALDVPGREPREAITVAGRALLDRLEIPAPNEVRFVGDMPVDHRHNARVDRARLALRL